MSPLCSETIRIPLHRLDDSLQYNPNPSLVSGGDVLNHLMTLSGSALTASLHRPVSRFSCFYRMKSVALLEKEA